MRNGVLKGLKGKALLITARGDIRFIRPKNGKTFSLRELQDSVGGNIEFVPNRYYPDFHIIANEEGLIRGLDFNELCYELFSLYLVGNVIAVPKEMIE